MTSESVTYGIGGYDPGHPNGNVAERVVDNGDGTGTRTIYDAAGKTIGTEALTGLPVAGPEPDLTAEVAAARASLAAATTVAQVRARTLAIIDLITTDPFDKEHHP